MSSIKNKIDALEDSLSPQSDVTKNLADRLKEARERTLEEGFDERVRDMEDFFKDHPEISPDDRTEVAKIRGQLMRERLKEYRGDQSS